MDGILALCHFCETHGPCVILCTQRSKGEPLQTPHTLTVTWCEACQSIDLSQALVSRDDKTTYVTTRTPQQQDLAFLLKQAAVRSLSCEEETSKEGGTLYFGDNERGHVISHTFTLRDSLARGFYRKYSIIMLMKDKIHLLNSWPMLVKNMKEVVKELQTQADAVNGEEQAQRPQRALRQAQGLSRNSARSLSQLTGRPAVFGHIHLWFTWMLSCETVVEKPSVGLPLPPFRSPSVLRKLAMEWEESVFHVACFCTVTGYRMEIDNSLVEDGFKILLPVNFTPLHSAPVCRLRNDGAWVAEWSGQLPPRMPTLVVVAEKGLKNEQLPDSALVPYINGIVLKWLHIAQSIHWSKGTNPQLLQALGVQSHDMPLINYWLTQLSLNK
ncbi:hypothetical protein PPYR_12766 [Photinus pyralis]|uniref:UDENN FLCN/SMCR8-type domain-containing protein n=2 Tax=Photinus pyralis TaxID=7054 RepID=A0A5N4A743_PHOPY|nr:folliculin [Photinus pyralis]KAB0793146.1 hypothetical protein PPYR_12766 [Photinus pyralis]